MAEEPLVAQVESAESARLSAEAAAEIAAVALQDAGADLARWQVRSDALAMALDEARARAGAERLAGLDGVLGTLLDLVEVDEGWEPAFEAAAGEAMLAVVVEEPATAAKALRHLMDGDATGAVLALRRPSGVVALSPVVGGGLVRRQRPTPATVASTDSSIRCWRQRSESTVGSRRSRSPPPTRRRSS